MAALAQKVIDTRDHRRVPVRVRCWCEGGRVTFYAPLLNLSEGGVFLRTYAPLRNGARTHLRFRLDGGGDPIDAEAQVVWVREPGQARGDSPGMGMRFVALGERCRALLRTFVSRQRDEAAGTAY